MNLYSVFDRQTLAYAQPFTQPTHGAAERVLRNEVNNDQSMLNKYSSDYELWYIGAFDERTGQLQTETEKHMLCNLSQLKERADA